MTETVNYKCLACEAPLRFDSKLGLLKCDHCDSTFEPAVIEQHYIAEQEKADVKAVERERKAAAANEELLYGFVCSSCGAELLVDATTAVTSCPYCSNNTIVPGAFAANVKPDYVIPFKQNKQAAMDALKHHYEGKPFLPNEFKDHNKLEEIKGVYVPFWLYTAQTEGEATFDASNTRVWTDGRNQITETDHYHVERSGTVGFEHVPVDSSTKMPNAHMDAIEPYDYSEMVPFSIAYMPGFMAEKYDEECEACKARVEPRMQNSTALALERTVTGYSSVSQSSARVGIDWKETAHAMLPVWMLHTKWNGEDFLFAMNGQTGRLIGDLPVAKGKVALWFTGIFFAVFVLSLALMIGGGLSVTGSLEGDSILSAGVGALVAGLVCMTQYQKMKTAQIKTEAEAYTSDELFTLTHQYDQFIHTTRTVIPLSRDDDNGPGMGAAIGTAAGIGMSVATLSRLAEQNRTRKQGGMGPGRPGGMGPGGMGPGRRGGMGPGGRRGPRF